MMQTPMPPPLPPGLDLNLVISQVIPIIGMVAVILVGASAVRWMLRGTAVGEAIAERIRMRAQRRWGAGGGGGVGGSGGEDPQRVEALEQEVSRLQAQVSELAERIDFAERMLAERRERKLGAGQ